MNSGIASDPVEHPAHYTQPTSLDDAQTVYGCVSPNRSIDDVLLLASRGLAVPIDGDYLARVSRK